MTLLKQIHAELRHWSPAEKCWAAWMIVAAVALVLALVGLCGLL